jgi:putative hydrolase of the HAD superfamily
MTNIKCIAFDLDDTLIDTSGLLVPEASRQACEAMKKLGLNCSLQECMSWREKLAKEMSHREIFLEIAKKYNHGGIENMAAAGIQTFYNPDIPKSLPLLPGAQTTLEYCLGEGYTLYLVTSGSPEAQRRKVKAAGLDDIFKKVYTLDGFKGEKKRIAFQDILKNEPINPRELLSVGNRLFEEIRQAKQLGATTCYFRYGEHVGEVPQVSEDHADYIVGSHEEFLKVFEN